MRIMIIVLASLALAACGHQSSPVAATSMTSTITNAPSGTTAATGPNHFDPAPIQGFDSAKWHDLTYKSPKYVLGRALVGLAPTEENLKRVSESQGLIYLGKDLVAFPDGTVFDCIYDDGGPKARWLFTLSH